MKATVKLKDTFAEGSLVISKEGTVYLVTVPAKGYDNDRPDEAFWGIPLNAGLAVSGGNYLKILFTKFSGSITLEQ